MEGGRKGCRGGKDGGRKGEKEYDGLEGRLPLNSFLYYYFFQGVTFLEVNLPVRFLSRYLLIIGWGRKGLEVSNCRIH